MKSARSCSLPMCRISARSSLRRVCLSKSVSDACSKVCVSPVRCGAVDRLIGTADGPKGIYGRRSLSKPPKLTILDLSHRPHHRRLPRQRFSATSIRFTKPQLTACPAPVSTRLHRTSPLQCPAAPVASPLARLNRSGYGSPKGCICVPGASPGPFFEACPELLECSEIAGFIGALGGIRTPDPQIRSLVLYPAELRAPQAFYRSEPLISTQA
jgi:hypothetical protein